MGTFLGREVPTPSKDFTLQVASQPMATGKQKLVLLATANLAKQERLAWLLEGTGFAWLTPQQAGIAPPPAREDGISHGANATAKAVAWSSAFGGLALASDGGLVIPALGRRWQPLWTRRFQAGDDLARAEALVEMMAGLEGYQRRAYWEETVAMADAGRVTSTCSARSGQGMIATDVAQELVQDGFWVGAVWRFPQLNKRYAELTPQELRQVGDHWAALKEKVRGLLGQVAGGPQKG